MPSMDTMIGLYVQLRDKKKQVQEQHKADLEPIDAGLMKLEARMQEALEEAGVKQMAGEHGTVFVKVNTSYSVEDWDAVWNYVRDNNAVDVLERRVSKTAVQERGDVPGLRSSQVRTLNVRRK